LRSGYKLHPRPASERRAGLGFAYVRGRLAAPDLAPGHLIEVLAGWMPSYGRFRLYYPSRKHIPAALRVFIDLAREIAPASPERVQIKRRKSWRRSALPDF
jgi:hypothetical protein